VSQDGNLSIRSALICLAASAKSSETYSDDDALNEFLREKLQTVILQLEEKKADATLGMCICTFLFAVFFKISFVSFLSKITCRASLASGA